MQASDPPLALRFTALSKSYEQERVLDRLGLEVRTGEFFGLVGVNGAGKTTCIKSLLDFCQVDSGEIEILGVPHTETRARAALAYLPERFLPPYYLTGADFLKYMARLYEQRFDEDAVREMLETLDLSPSVLNRPARHYSKGMAQKLGLAACFLSRRPIIVLDEPMSGLDPKARILVKRYLHRLKGEDRTLLVSTHMLSDVAELCDRMGILHEGVLRYVGSPKGCCERFAAPDLELAYLRCIELEAPPSRD